MKPANLAIAILAIGLVVSVALNVWMYHSNQQLGTGLEEMSQKVDSLNQSFLAINNSYTQMVEDMDHFNAQVNQNSTFQTPVSKSQAIGIALVWGGWNATSLRGQVVDGNLEHVIYNSTAGSFELVNVTEPEADYSRTEEGDTERWYEWVVTIASNWSYPFFHTSCHIDASTGEVYSTMGVDAVILTEEDIARLALWEHYLVLPPYMLVGQSFSITYQSHLVTLFTYDGWVNNTGAMVITTPEATLVVQQSNEYPPKYTISYNEFKVVGSVHNSYTGFFIIHSINVGEITLFQYPITVY